jgi:hypothetical protein
MAERWVKLYEKIENSAIYQDSEMVHLWLHLLIKATKFEYKVDWGGKEIVLKPGQLITGRKKLSSVLKIHESKIQRFLKRFEKWHMIEQRTNRQSRIITILNWDQYQSNEQRSNNDRTTSEQRLNTNKKERKKERKNNTIQKPESVSEQTWNDFLIHRKNKKAIVTENVIKGFSREAEKAGWTLESAIKKSIERGWTGFESDWVDKQKNNSNDNGRSSAQLQIEETQRLINGN